MNKEKIIIFLCLLITIFSISKAYANIETNTLEGKTIYLDPGHGGIDSGTTYKKILEKDINLVICQKLKTALTNEGAIVYLTREKDTDLSVKNKHRKRSDLISRAYLINKTKPDLYISIHQNYIANTKWKGTQIFYTTRNKNNKDIAEKLTKYLKEKSYSVRPPKQNNTYYMYRNIDPPGVLIEVGFLSNPDDRYRLTHEKYQDIIVDNLLYSIKKYFATKNT